MITEHDLEAAIAECQGKRNPDAKTCIMLAAFYTIKREMFGEEKKAEPAYSYAPARMSSDSEFARAVEGMDQSEVMDIMDELMQTLKVVLPRLYDVVMEKLA